MIACADADAVVAVKSEVFFLPRQKCIGKTLFFVSECYKKSPKMPRMQTKCNLYETIILTCQEKLVGVKPLLYALCI